MASKNQTTQTSAPVICGSFTNWIGRPMVSLFDFLQSKDEAGNRLDERTIFEFLRDNGEFDE